MSLKIERDTVTTVKDAVQGAVVNKGGFVGETAAAVAEAATGNLPGTKGKHPISAVVGTAITGGRQNAGTKGYLAVCLFRNTSAQMRQPGLTPYSFPRPTSGSWRTTRCAPRCSQPAPCPVARS